MISRLAAIRARPRATKAGDDVFDRFDQSFVVHMIRDFFLLLLAVAVLELVARLVIVVYEFETEGHLETRVAAERLAEDVRSIMLNEGGPVAARTVYPMLRENHEALGLIIAVEPSEVTIESIERVFDFTPRGIPARWPSGRHQSASVQVRAEPTCLSCHLTAKDGDVLGTITVRSYLSRHIARWWEEVRLTGLLGVGKIILHSVLLFVLLRWRMAPLLSLKGVVSRLARAGSDLSYRATVRSSDEFGTLARDLNLFLDRISHIVDDLSNVLGKIATVNEHLVQIQGDVGERLRKIRTSTEKLDRSAFSGARGEPVLSEEWLAAMRLALAALEQLTQVGLDDRRFAHREQEIAHQLSAVVARANALMAEYDRLTAELGELSSELDGFRDALGEMARLEERMRGVAELGRTLVGRLRPTEARAEP